MRDDVATTAPTPQLEADQTVAERALEGDLAAVEAVDWRETEDFHCRTDRQLRVADITRIGTRINFQTEATDTRREGLARIPAHEGARALRVPVVVGIQPGDGLHDGVELLIPGGIELSHADGIGRTFTLVCLRTVEMEGRQWGEGWG